MRLEVEAECCGTALERCDNAMLLLLGVLLSLFDEGLTAGEHEGHHAQACGPPTVGWRAWCPYEYTAVGGTRYVPRHGPGHEQKMLGTGKAAQVRADEPPAP